MIIPTPKLGQCRATPSQRHALDNGTSPGYELTLIQRKWFLRRLGVVLHHPALFSS